MGKLSVVVGGVGKWVLKCFFEFLIDIFFKVLLVGRFNVGKLVLFNRCVVCRSF